MGRDRMSQLWWVVAQGMFCTELVAGSPQVPYCGGVSRQEQLCFFWTSLMDRLDFCMGERKEKEK